MSTTAGGSYAFGPFLLEGEELRLLCRGQQVPLTPKVFEVLRLLVERSGHLVERETLLTEVWRDSFVEEASLSRAISVLRKILEEGDPGAIYIETIPKRGYRFIAPVNASRPVGRRRSGRPRLNARRGRDRSFRCDHA